MLIDTDFYLKKAHDFNLAWKQADQLKTDGYLPTTEQQYYQHKSDFMRQQKNNCQIMAIRQAFTDSQVNSSTPQLICYLDPAEEGEVYSLSLPHGNRCHIPKSVLLDHLTQQELEFIFSLDTGNHK